MSSISPAVCQHTSELQEIAMSGEGGGRGEVCGEGGVGHGRGGEGLGELRGNCPPI